MSTRKQIGWIQTAPIIARNLTALGLSTDISADLDTLLDTAGRNSSPIPLQVSTSETGIGLICTGVNNRVKIVSSLTQSAIIDRGKAVYGRLTNDYTLRYYTRTGTTESTYTFTAATQIDFIFNYRFDSARLPADVLVDFPENETKSLVIANKLTNQPGFAHGDWFPVIYDNVLTDNYSEYNSTNGEFIPKVGGLYDIDAGVTLDNAFQLGNLAIYINGINTRYIDDKRLTTDNQLFSIGGGKIYLEAGNILTIRLLQLNTTSSTRSVTTEVKGTFLNITKVY